MVNGTEKAASLARVVRDTIEKEPYIRNPLADGLINYSALARMLTPAIERELNRSVREESLMVAIKRYADEIQGKASNKQSMEILSQAVLSMQEDVSFAWLKSNETVLLELQHLINKTDWHPAELRIIVEGPERTIVVLKTSKMDQLLAKVNAETIESSNGHVLITIRAPEKLRKTHGVIAELTSTFSRKGISVDLITASPDLHFLVEDKDADEAYRSIKQQIRDAKKSVIAETS
jgi:hypothetical protein